MKNLATALKKITGNSIASISQTVGVPQTTLNRQAKENEIPTSTLVKICLCYNVSIIDVLFAADLINKEQAREMRGVVGLDAYSQVELAEEVYNRELNKQVERLKKKESRYHLYALAAESDDQQDLDEGEMY